MSHRKKLGQLLLERSYVQNSGLAEALAVQEKRGGKLGQVLMEMGQIKKRHLAETLAAQAGIMHTELERIQIDPELLSLVPADLVSKYNVLPVSRENGRLTVAMVDPFETRAIEELRLVTGLAIRRNYANPPEMEKAIQHFYGSNVTRMLEDLAPGDMHDGVKVELSENGEMTAARLSELAREPSLINLVNLVVLEAIEARASDIHIEPFEKEVRIKYRVDGMLIDNAEYAINDIVYVTGIDDVESQLFFRMTFVGQSKT